ncbi:MAG: hypothetical protein C0501_07120 [Isosphaera sp.]|nr:hypothetical protein [Isosphaera sp.]
MTLLLTLVLVALVLFALFLGGSIVAQGYLYQAPADRLPLRALAAAALVASFLTIWVWIDQRAPRKYDTFFEFAPYQTQTFDEFEAVRWVSPDGSTFRVDAAGKPVEEVTRFRRGVGAKAAGFYDAKTDEPFQMNSSSKGTNLSYMTAAVRVSPAKGAEPVRLGAVLGKDKRSYAAGPEGRKFVEDGGTRYVQADQLGTLFVPSNTTVFLALLINFLHFVAWFVAFWLILQFTRGHAFVLAVSFGLGAMLLLMPLLFKPNRAPKPPGEVPQAARAAEVTAPAPAGT